jgi:hypothetical protein
VLPAVVQLTTIVMFNQFLSIFLQVAIPSLKAKAQAKALDLKMAKLEAEAGEGEELNATAVGDESRREVYPSVFMDYATMATQFGYITLFGVAFPLAPAMCMINNLIEIRSDAYKLVKVHRRPPIETREDIGSWQLAFETIAVVAVITSACLIGFVGSQLQTELETTASYDEIPSAVVRFEDHRLWVVTVITEHAVLALRFLLQAMVPSTPNWVAQTKLMLDEENKDRLLTDEEKVARDHQHDEFTAQQIELQRQRRQRYLKAEVHAVGELLVANVRAMSHTAMWSTEKRSRPPAPIRPPSATEAELTGMKMTALKARAREWGITEDELYDADDSDDPKGTVIQAILNRQPRASATEAELASMKMTALKARAREWGVTEDELYDADDSDDPKGTVIQAILNRQSDSSGGSRRQVDDI